MELLILGLIFNGDGGVGHAAQSLFDLMGILHGVGWGGGVGLEVIDVVVEVIQA